MGEEGIVRGEEDEVGVGRSVGCGGLVFLGGHAFLEEVEVDGADAFVHGGRFVMNDGFGGMGFQF